VFFVVCDGLKGLPEVVGNAWPQAIVQTCIVHLIRGTFHLASKRDWDALKRDVRPVYTAVKRHSGAVRARRAGGEISLADADSRHARECFLPGGCQGRTEVAKMNLKDRHPVRVSHLIPSAHLLSHRRAISLDARRTGDLRSGSVRTPSGSVPP
jgi:hypothetical protein